jgi:hypothetical protein
MKKEAWLCQTTRKNNPLYEEQARGIHSDIEELLTREVNSMESRHGQKCVVKHSVYTLCFVACTRYVSRWVTLLCQVNMQFQG